MAAPVWQGTRQTVQTGDIQNAPGGFCQCESGKLVYCYNASEAHAGSGSIVIRSAASEAAAAAGTFSSPTTIASEDATYYYGDPRLTRVLEGSNAGRIWITYNRATVASGPRTLNLQLKYSDDEGATWSSAINVTGIGNGAGTAYGLSGHASSAPPVEKPGSDGLVWIWPHWQYDLGNTTGYARCLTSTDGGLTWSVLSTIVPYSASYDTSEHHIAVVKLADDSYRLVCSIVYLGASATINTSYSDDWGATWSTMATALTNATASPALLQLTDRSVVMLYRNLADSEHTWMARSTDYGATFPVGGRTVVDSASRMRYGQWQNLLSGNLGLAYCTEASSTSAALYWKYATQDPDPFPASAQGYGNNIGAGYGDATVYTPPAGASLTIDPASTAWEQIDTSILVRTTAGASSVAATVTSTEGGLVRFQGVDADRFRISLDGTAWEAMLDIPAGETAVQLRVTPAAPGATLAAEIGIPV